MWPSGQYQTGIRWPHQSWRLTFQSRMPVSQCSQIFSNRSGRNRHGPGTGDLKRSFRERRGPNEPLRLEAGLDDVVGSLTPSEHQLVGSLTLQVAPGCQILEDTGASGELVQTRVDATVIVDRAFVGHHVNRSQTVTPAGLEVGGVVRRRDLDRARAERPIHRFVRHDRDGPLDERDTHATADVRRVPLILRMDCNAGISQDRLGSGRRDRDPGIRQDRFRGVIHEVIPNGPERSGGLRRDDLEVGQAGPARRTPVDERL